MVDENDSRASAEKTDDKSDDTSSSVAPAEKQKSKEVSARGAKKDKPNTNDSLSDKASSSLHKKIGATKFRVVVLVVVSLIAVLILGYLVISDFSEEPSQPVTLDTTYEDTEFTYSQKAEQLAFYDDYDSAQQLLQEGADNSGENDKTRADFYLEKTLIAFNAGEFEDALVFAKNAEELNANASSASLIADTSEALGDNPTAIDYWILAAERTPIEQRNPDSFGGEYGYYLFRIEELGGMYEP